MLTAGLFFGQRGLWRPDLTASAMDWSPDVVREITLNGGFLIAYLTEVGPVLPYLTQAWSSRAPRGDLRAGAVTTREITAPRRAARRRELAKKDYARF